MEVPEGRGLTWRSLSATLWAVAIVQPAIIYLYLVTGLSLPLSVWLVILFWSEIARFMGKPLTAQEIFIINSFEWTAITGAWIFVNPIRNINFILSPITEAFGFKEQIPNWWAPPYTASVDILFRRTFLDTYWLLPILVLILAAALDTVANISMGYFCYALYVRVQRLDFPAAMAGAQTIMTIAEREPKRMRILMLTIIFGFMYGFASYLLPELTGSAYMRLVPRGPVDINYLVEWVLPGGSFGLDTTVYIFAQGFIIPIQTLIVMFITSIGAYLFGNYLLVQNGVWPEWVPGTTMIVAVQRSHLYFWTSAGFGLALAATFLPILAHPKILARAFSGLRGTGEGKGIGTSLWLILGIFIFSTVGSTILTYILVPQFPVWILLLFTVGGSFFASLISANAAGLTFGGFNIPYLREAVIYFSGYRGVDIWFANYLTWGTPNVGLPMLSVGGASIAASFKQADIVGCRPSEFIKAFVIVTVMGWIASFFYSSILWSASPIPSSAYPYTITGWPVEFLERNRWINWIWSGILFKPSIILGGFLTGCITFAISEFLRMPAILISMTAGLFLPMQTVVSQFIGGLIGHFILRRAFGDTWRFYAPIIPIGLTIGDLLASGLALSILLVGKAQWILPY